MHVRGCSARAIFRRDVLAATSEVSMIPTSEKISRIAIRAVITGAAAAVVYALSGWAGLAALALIQMAEIADKLGEIRDRLSVRPGADVS
jgi:hypothetical protein